MPLDQRILVRIGSRWRLAALGLGLVLGGSLLFGLYGPPNLARLASAHSPAVSPTDRPTTSLSLEVTARAGVEMVGEVKSGGIWAVKGSALLISTDAGQTWRGRSIPRAHINHFVGDTVFVFDPDHAWTITDARTIYRTADGGATWEGATLPDNCSTFFGLGFLDVHVGYVNCLYGAAATVMRTADGGATWTVVTTSASTSSGPIGSNLMVVDRQTLWAGANDWDNGTQALLAVSRDGGATWSDAALPGINPVDQHPNGPGASLPDFPTALDGYVWAVDRSPNSARMYRTRDGGLTWKEESRPPDQARIPASVLSLDSWVAYEGSPPQILHSSDAGAHWSAVAAGGMPDPAPAYFFEFSDERHGAAKIGQVLLVTADGGRSWTAPDLTAAAPAPPPGAGGDEAAVRAVVNAYEQARLDGNQAVQNGLLSPDCQLPEYQTDASPPPTPTVFQIAGMVRSGLQLDPSFGSAYIDADYSRIYTVTVREKLRGGSTTETKLLVAPLLGSGWKIWTAPDVVPEK